MVKADTENALDQGKGILRLAPTWVPRVFCKPGKRLKLHPNDYYSLGTERGGIDERWLSSTTPAINGPLTTLNEGLSSVVLTDNGKDKKILLKDVIDNLKNEIIGNRLWNQYRGWPLYSKFFDNMGPLPHHIHPSDKFAARVGMVSKPESYYFPPQMNSHFGNFPYTFFGITPGTTQEQIRECLVNFNKGDNKITEFSIAFKLALGTGWDVPPGLLHAPGSMCTYEPQKASDVLAMYESVIDGTVIPDELLWNATPKEGIGNIDFLMEVIDWDLNTDEKMFENRFMPPVLVKPLKEMHPEGYIEKWISYRSTAFSAKELTVLPGKTVTIYDQGAYGMVMVQGHGKFGIWDIETPILIRYGQLTNDEFFVTENTAKEGVVISNESMTDPLVMLKHFGPGNPELKTIHL